MKVLGIAIFIFSILNSCVGSNTVSSIPNKDSLYLVTAIDSINTWYTIYATKGDSVYKIVVKKNGQNLACKRAITIGQSYNLVLNSRKKALPVEFRPANYLDVQCYTYDDSTSICIDIKKGIYDLYVTSNFKGLCYIE